MDFREAGFDIGPHHVARFAHRLLRGPVLPWIGPEMVAAEDDATQVDAFLSGQVFDEGFEGGRRHAGVAAVLVHLIAGGLDQDRIVGVAMGGEHGGERLRMRGAPGGDAALLAGAVVGDDRAQRRRGRSCATRQKVFKDRERRALPSIGPTFVTASAPAALARSIACAEAERARGDERDEGGAEAVAGAGRIENLHLMRRKADPLARAAHAFAAVARPS